MKYRVHIEMSRDGYPLRLNTALLVGGSSQGVAVRPLEPRATRTIALAKPGTGAPPAVDAFVQAAVAWVQGQ